MGTGFRLEEGSQRALSLHPSRSVSPRQLLHLGDADTVEVALDGVLQSGSGNRKLNGGLGVLAREQGVDQPCAKAVTAANAVDDVEMVGLEKQ